VCFSEFFVFSIKPFHILIGKGFENNSFYFSFACAAVPFIMSADGPPVPRRAAQWGDDAPKQPQQQQLDRKKYDSEVIAVIPDITDDVSSTAESFATQVADAPAAALPRMPALRELDATVKFRLPPAHDPDVDLSLLISALAPHSQLNEGRAAWTFESVFSEVSAELQSNADVAE
jgi:hypothetical protein